MSRSSSNTRLRTLVLIVAAGLGFGTPAGAAQSRIALADIYYLDTSGEPGERTAEHAARTKLFQSVLGEELERDGAFAVEPLACGRPDCSIGAISVEDAVEAARRSGADYVLLGAIQKISTLIGTGRIDVIEIATKRDVVSRVLSFRGDTDDAFRRAAEFAARSVAGAGLGRGKASPDAGTLAPKP